MYLEAGFSDSGSDWFYGSLLYPSDAFDWEDTIHEPQDFLFLQSRWEKEHKLGRKFHNIKLDGVLDTKFTSIYSNTMPEAGHGFWKHKPDTRPNITIDRDAPMKLQGTRRQADIASVLTKSNNLIDNKEKLDKLFGKYEPKLPELSKDFDKPWVHKKDKKSK